MEAVAPNVPATAVRTEQQARPWHSLAVADAQQALGAAPTGLTSVEAARRLRRHGQNALPTTAGKSALRRFLEQFHNLLIYVLIGAAVITALLGHPLDTVVIVAVVIVNTIIGFVQEGKAEAALQAIRAMISPKASVLREGRRLSIDAAEIVPGDTLLLEPGDRVTADVRLTKARNLRIDEAILTGESAPVTKITEPVSSDALLGDRKCMAYSGTLVTSGQGTGVVVATGTTTELGRISALLGGVEQLETPLLRQVNAFARQLTFIILALAAVTFGFATIVRSYPAAEAFMAVVAIAVAAIPEGLPAVMTITLAIGVQRMAARNAIIRRLPVVETLGSVSTICSDKTGTLTRNEMTVTRVVLAERSYEVGGIGYAPKGGFSIDGQDTDPAADDRLLEIGRAALLCNDAAIREVSGRFFVDGDPMEGALVALGLKAGHDRNELAKAFPRVDEIPFDAAHCYMATLHHRHDGPAFVCVKGAPERVIEMCQLETGATGARPVDRSFWMSATESLARDGRRVLALATREFPPEKRDLSFADVEQRLTLLGLVGLIDPPRPEVITAIAECRSAGIAVKMVTGDHAATAAAIAGALGLENAGSPLTGRDLESLDENDLRRAVAETSVFARTSPEHKLRLVESLQAGRAVIAMTGDGVNDAPALKRADVGVAMGKTGTEAAKEASDMVLADDNFASIVAAVREGRTVYDNLSKVIGFILPINGGESILITTAILLGLTLPITPLQVLWVNMVSSVALALTLAFEPAEPGIMRRPPRRSDAPILSGLLVWRIVLVSTLFAIGAFGMFTWAESRGHSHEAARTMVVNTIVVMEIFYLFSVRYIHGTSVTWQGLLGTPAVLIGVGSIVVLQFAFTYLPFMQRLFQTRAVAIGDGVVIIAIGIALLLVLEVVKRCERMWSRTGDTRRDSAAEMGK